MPTTTPNNTESVPTVTGKKKKVRKNKTKNKDKRSNKKKVCKKVNFGSVSVREHERILIANTACSAEVAASPTATVAAALALGWSYNDEVKVFKSVEDYENRNNGDDEGTGDGALGSKNGNTKTTTNSSPQYYNNNSSNDANDRNKKSYAQYYESQGKLSPHRRLQILASYGFTFKEIMVEQARGQREMEVTERAAAIAAAREKKNKSNNGTEGDGTKGTDKYHNNNNTSENKTQTASTTPRQIVRKFHNGSSSSSEDIYVPAYVGRRETLSSSSFSFLSSSEDDSSKPRQEQTKTRLFDIFRKRERKGHGKSNQKQQTQQRQQRGLVFFSKLKIAVNKQEL